jgi:hypothetical protein
MVAFEPTHVSLPGAAMVGFVSAMSKNEATRKFKLSCLFMFFPPNAYLDSSLSFLPVSLLPRLPQYEPWDPLAAAPVLRED